MPAAILARRSNAGGLPVLESDTGQGMTEPLGTPERDIDGDHLVETPESLRDVDEEGLPLDRGREPGEGPAAADRYGTTHTEEEQGEDLDHRLAQEEPDVGATPDTPRFDSLGEDVAAEDLVLPAGEETQVGRLVEPDEGAHTDTEEDVIATDVGNDAGDVSAEEAAMHIQPE
jgi:hypothetical protein